MGKSKTPKVKESAPVQSAYQPFQAFTVDLGGFGSSTSSGSGSTLATRFTPTPEFAKLQTNTLTGLTGQQEGLNKPLDQQYSELGQNPFYLAAAEQNKLNYGQQSAQLQQSMSQRGLQDSTVLGAFAAQQARDANLLDQQARANAINQQNQLGLANFQSNQALLGQLAAIAQQPTELANQNLQTAFSAKDSAAFFNAQQQQQAAIINAQMQFQAQQAEAQRRNALLGAGIGLAGTLGSAGILGAFSKGVPNLLGGGAWSPNTALMTPTNGLFGQYIGGSNPFIRNPM